MVITYRDAGAVVAVDGWQVLIAIPLDDEARVASRISASI